VAHAFGVSVEGEIGYLGFEEGADEDPTPERAWSA
jgi:fructose/tagatose bisphosphate aldolase